MTEGNVFTLSTISGRGVPYPMSGWWEGGTPTRSVWWGGYPSQVWMVGGYPIQVGGGRSTLARSGWWGVPRPGLDGGGTPARSGWWGGYPSQVWLVGGYPEYPPGQVWMGTPRVPTPHHDWIGYPSTMTGWGTPHHDWMGYPPPWLDGVPPTMAGWGTPPA